MNAKICFCILLAFALNVMLLFACSAPSGSVSHVVKVGLVAPFEGPQRATAYDTLFAVKRAIKQHNDVYRTTGPLVELVALNNNGLAINSEKQALQMIVDPAILGVVEPWMGNYIQPDTEIYQRTGLPTLYPMSQNEIISPFLRADWACNAMAILLTAIQNVSLRSNLTRQSIGKELDELLLLRPADTLGIRSTWD